MLLYFYSIVQFGNGNVIPPFALVGALVAIVFVFLAAVRLHLSFGALATASVSGTFEAGCCWQDNPTSSYQWAHMYRKSLILFDSEFVSL